MKTNEFIHALLEAARESGIPEAEAYYHQAESMRALVNKGVIEDFTVNKTGGVSLRGLIDGKMGMSYTEALDKDAIVMLIRSVLDSATLTSDQDPQFVFAGSPAYAAVNALGDTGSVEERIDLALALDEVGRHTDPHVTELGFTFVETEHETIRLVNSHGLDLSHSADVCFAYTNPIARKGERVSTGEAMAAGRNLSSIDPAAVAREAIEGAVMQLDASPCESGEMPVIFRNDAMTSLLGTFCGIFSAEAAQKGLSLLAGREGQPIAASCVTIVDDPLRPEGLFTRAFDGEGVATQTKSVIKDGTLQTLLHNLKTANKAGVASTGNADRSGYVGPVTVAPSNLFLAPGTMDLPALESAMGDGIVITMLEGLHAGANAVSGDFSLLCCGYRVQGGKRAQAVEQVTVAGNFLQLLQRIQAVGSDLKAQTGRVFCPSVWVDSLSIAGK